MSLAIVEDDDDYREQVLVPGLAAAGFRVEGMRSALDLYRAMVTRRYHLVVLDAGLPDATGHSIAAHLRSVCDAIGIVMLAGLAPVGQHPPGARAGVDAYLHKPVDIDALAITLWTLARRAGTGTQQAQAVQPAGWRLDGSGWELLGPGGTAVPLSMAERQLLSLLLAQPGVPVRREMLVGKLAVDIHDFDPRRLEMLVYRLRRKCRQACAGGLPLRAVRGVGYVLVQ